MPSIPKNWTPAYYDAKSYTNLGINGLNRLIGRSVTHAADGVGHGVVVFLPSHLSHTHRLNPSRNENCEDFSRWKMTSPRIHGYRGPVSRAPACRLNARNRGQQKRFRVQSVATALSTRTKRKPGKEHSLDLGFDQFRPQSTRKSAAAAAAAAAVMTRFEMHLP